MWPPVPLIAQRTAGRDEPKRLRWANPRVRVELERNHGFHWIDGTFSRWHMATCYMMFYHKMLNTALYGSDTIILPYTACFLALQCLALCFSCLHPFTAFSGAAGMSNDDLSRQFPGVGSWRNAWFSTRGKGMMGLLGSLITRSFGLTSWKHRRAQGNPERTDAHQ